MQSYIKLGQHFTLSYHSKRDLHSKKNAFKTSCGSGLLTLLILVTKLPMDGDRAADLTSGG
jgi:hypothetical protein